VQSVPDGAAAVLKCQHVARAQHISAWKPCDAQLTQIAGHRVDGDRAGAEDHTGRIACRADVARIMTQKRGSRLIHQSYQRLHLRVPRMIGLRQPDRSRPERGPETGADHGAVTQPRVLLRMRQPERHLLDAQGTEKLCMCQRICQHHFSISTLLSADRYRTSRLSAAKYSEMAVHQIVETFYPLRLGSWLTRATVRGAISRSYCCRLPWTISTD